MPTPLAPHAPDRTTRRALVGAAADARRLDVDGARLALDDAGDGPAVLCLHAIGHGAADWAALRARLAPRYRVLALDWPGQGRSGADHEAASAARYEALLAGVVDALALPRVVLVGNSIGGATAIRYAAAHPDRVAGLVLANPGGLAPIADRLAQTVINGLARFFEAGARGARWFPPAFAAYYRTVLRAAPAREQRRRIVASAYEIAPVLAQAWRGFATPAADIRHLAPRLACPTLFTWATQDNLVQLRRSLPAIRTVPNARLETFRAGHAPQLETPGAFAAAVERFLDALPATERRHAQTPLSCAS